MYTVRTTQEFDKDVKLCKMKGRNMKLLKEVIELLSADGTLPEEYKPHMLRDEYAGLWECHIEEFKRALDISLEQEEARGDEEKLPIMNPSKS